MFVITKKSLQLAGNFHHEKIPEMCFKAIQILLVFSQIFCFTLFFVFIPRSFNNISETAVAFGLGTTAFLALVKSFTFYWLKQKFYDLMQQVEDFAGEGL